MMTQVNLQGFYRLPLEERHARLNELHYTSDAEKDYLKNNQGLPLDLADKMVENLIGTYSLPLGLAMNFVINQKDYLIPMAIEEPSVIAAASYAAKMAKAGGGFHCEVLNRQMTGQMVFLGLDQASQAETWTTYIKDHQEDLIQVANQAHPSLSRRGGGVRQLEMAYYPSESEPFFVVYMTVDTQEAMGANMMNTMLEALASHIEALSQKDESLPRLEKLMAILSNLATQCLAKATCQIPIDALAKPGQDPQVVAKRISQASQLAQVDPYRATTHNKGIMNGVDALVLASGNDWRAVEAACHAYASQSGQYRGLAKWDYLEDQGLLAGEITLPLALGSVGGSIKIHPAAKLVHHLLNQPSASDLMKIVAALGLAQNLAALRALVIEGIQAGHMSLQARSLAIAVGAQGDEVDQVSQALQKAKHMDRQNAKAILDALRQ
ncbi:hydroxymethylglutaryl-CoA reductase, degradative [Aerococcus urinae]|uniref:hydroxymethylglutaryl-CoA reductase, degradative n=1 Tax=Aerococcus urinae TaxID=1376 RepID=UPI003B434D2B